MDAVIAILIALLLAGTYVLILVKAHWSVRIVVSALLIVGSIKVTALWTAARERNTIWNRSVRPLENFILPAMQEHLKRGHTNEVSAAISRLNEGGLLSGTFFGRTNFLVYDDVFTPLDTTNSASSAKQ